MRDNSGAPAGGLYKQIFRLKVVHLLAFFTLAYVGTEVSIGGWIVTFIIQERNGGSSSGYISSGFFAGLTVGRLALLPANRKVSLRENIDGFITNNMMLFKDRRKARSFHLHQSLRRVGSYRSLYIFLMHLL